MECIKQTYLLSFHSIKALSDVIVGLQEEEEYALRIILYRIKSNILLIT